jgi:polyisoprenoid-binding protein YceI
VTIAHGPYAGPDGCLVRLHAPPPGSDLQYNEDQKLFTTLVTGNKLRDRDMRASMEVDRYPTMRFDVLGATTVPSLATRVDTLAMLLHGNLAIHGVTRVVDLPVMVSRTADTIHVTAVFPLDLADYHISGLTKMFGILRMQRRIEVRADLRFVRARDAP